MTDYDISIVTGSDGNNYKVCNGTYYDIRTPDKAVRVLEDCRIKRKRVRLFYAYQKEEDKPIEFVSDYEAGCAWNEEYETIGRIGRSTGNIKIPLLIKTGRSFGGGGLLDDVTGCIVDIENKAVLYKADNFHFPEWDIKGNPMTDEELSLVYKTDSMKDFKVYATMKSTELCSLCRLQAFMEGKRNTKGGRCLKCLR